MANSVMVRIPKELKARLDRVAGEMLETYESGRGCQDIEIAEQGVRGSWVPLHAVINKALDELEKARSRKSSRKNRELVEV